MRTKKCQTERWIGWVIWIAPTPELARDFLEYDCGTRYTLSTVKEVWAERNPTGYDEANRRKWDHLIALTSANQELEGLV